MEEFSASVVNGDSGLAGLKVAEQLQTLSVACEGTCPPGGAAEEGKEGAALPLEGCPAEAPEAAPDGSDVGERRSPYPGPCRGLVGPAAAGEVATEEGPPPLGNGSLSSHSGWTGPRGDLGEGGEPRPEEKPRGGREAGPEGESDAGPVEGGSLGLDPNSSPSPLDPHEPDCTSTALASERRPAALGRGQEAASVMEGSGDSSSSGTSSSESESSSESDTDTDSSSSDSSSSSCLPMLSEDDDGHQQNKNEDNSCSTTKNGELSQEPLSIEDVKIILPESVELMPFGKVSSIIGHQVIIESQKGLPPVNEDTVLFRDDRHSVGKVFEVFGPVSHPFYVLQFNSPEHIEVKGIKIHDAVYFAPSVESFTQYIFPEKLKQEKGSDASWKNDEEPPPEALDFSDDEKEKAAKQQKKSQNLRRKKFRSQQDCNENGINYKPRQQYPSDYSGGYCRGEPHPTFSRGRFPHSSAPPRFFRHQARTPQHYSSRCAEPWKPSTFCQQQRPESLRRHQYSFPPPTFETVNNEANFPPPQQSVTWGWPPGYTQNICDPLLSLLSLPPPPPPPIPPPPAVAPFDSINPP